MFNDLLTFLGIEKVDKPIVYIAGKIRNEPNYIKLFDEASRNLQADYIPIPANEVVNFVQEQNNDDANEHQIWAAIIEVIEKVEAVFFLDNWVTSAGAKLELHIAKYYKKQIWFQSQAIRNYDYKVKNLLPYLQSYFKLPRNWQVIRDPWFVFIKKVYFWVLTQDYGYPITGDRSIKNLGQLTVNHSTVITQVSDINWIIDIAKSNSEYMIDEVNKINSIRNVITEYMESSDE